MSNEKVGINQRFGKRLKVIKCGNAVYFIFIIYL
jgi:hypothetical protein